MWGGGKWGGGERRRRVRWGVRPERIVPEARGEGPRGGRGRGGRGGGGGGGGGGEGGRERGSSVAVTTAVGVPMLAVPEN